MTVKELIEALQKCNPKEKVRITVDFDVMDIKSIEQISSVNGDDKYISIEY